MVLGRVYIYKTTREGGQRHCGSYPRAVRRQASVLHIITPEEGGETEHGNDCDVRRLVTVVRLAPRQGGVEGPNGLCEGLEPPVDALLNTICGGGRWFGGSLGQLGSASSWAYAPTNSPPTQLGLHLGEHFADGIDPIVQCPRPRLGLRCGFGRFAERRCSRPSQISK